MCVIQLKITLTLWNIHCVECPSYEKCPSMACRLFRLAKCIWSPIYFKIVIFEELKSFMNKSEGKKINNKNNEYLWEMLKS